MRRVLGDFSIPEACHHFRCGKKAYCIILGAGKEAYCTKMGAGKEAYCPILGAEMDIYGYWSFRLPSRIGEGLMGERSDRPHWVIRKVTKGLKQGQGTQSQTLEVQRKLSESPEKS